MKVVHESDKLKPKGNSKTKNKMTVKSESQK
jgi:hypothetical protein